MMRKQAKIPQTPEGDGAPRLDRRQFERLELPATAFALNMLGKDLGRIVEIGGGGLLIDPASPWARLSLVKGQQLVVTVVEPASGNQTDVGVEVRHVRAHRIGLRFL
jgi:hypothetical protein